MTSSRVWLDATQTVIDALGGHIDAYPAVPNPRPDEFVVVRRDGGSQDGVLDSAEMSIEVWSGQPNTSLQPVTALAGEVRELLRTMPDTTVGVVRWTEDTFGLLPDEVTDTPRVLIFGTVWLKPTSGS